MFSLLQFSPTFWDLGFLTTSLAGKHQGKEDFQYLSLFPILCNQITHLVQQWARVLPSLPFVMEVHVETLPVFFDILSQIQFYLKFSFPNWFLDAQTTSLYSFHITCTCFHPLRASFLSLSFAKSSLFIHTDLLTFFPDFLFTETDCSWVSRRSSLNISHFYWSPLRSRDLFHGVLPSRI